MAKARRLNWANIREQFYETHQQTGISRNAWAKLHGISPNTARRHIPMTKFPKFETLKSGKRINESDHAITFEERDQLRDHSNATSPDMTGDTSEVITRSNEMKERNKTLKVDALGGFVSGKSDHAHNIVNEQCGSQTGGNNSSQEGHYRTHMPQKYALDEKGD